mgnify:CR=1 FL=1
MLLPFHLVSLRFLAANQFCLDFTFARVVVNRARKNFSDSALSAGPPKTCDAAQAGPAGAPASRRGGTAPGLSRAH